MDEIEQHKAFLTALTTEHFVLQGSIGATLSEMQSRASMFIGALTGALVAMGFATQSQDVFLPFVATVLPAIFLLGVLTVLRLTDISIENANAEVGVARVHRQYRELGPEAAAFSSRGLDAGRKAPSILRCGWARSSPTGPRRRAWSPSLTHLSPGRA